MSYIRCPQCNCYLEEVSNGFVCPECDYYKQIVEPVVKPPKEGQA